MKFTHLLTLDNIRQGVMASSKKRILEILSEILTAQTGDDTQVCFESLCEREKIGCTALGNGIALPHARLPHGHKPIAIFLQLANPIEYKAPDNREVDLLLALFIPADLCSKCGSLLPEIAKKLSNKNSIVLHVIKSINDENEQVYYVDENGLIRVWEELIATFENGVKI